MGNSIYDCNQHIFIVLPTHHTSHNHRSRTFCGTLKSREKEMKNSSQQGAIYTKVRPVTV